MRVTHVAVRSSRAVRNYQHFHVEIRARVEKGEDPCDVIDWLKDALDDELARVGPGTPPEFRVLKFSSLRKKRP